MLTSSTLARAVVGIATTVALSGCGLHGKPKVERKARAAAALPAAVASRASADSQPTSTSLGRSDVVAPGIVEPWGAQVELAAQEPGWIAAIVVHEGEAVRAGQLLATLEDETQRRAVELARAELTEAEAALEKTERGATPEELRQAQADYAAAAARSKFASAAAARTSRLHQDSSVSDNDAEQVAANALADAALAERALARLQQLKVGDRIEDRNATRARTAAARARLRMADAGLAHRRIAAPSAGTVLLSRFHPGEFYNASAGPLFVLGDVSRLQVRLEVDEIDAHDVARGTPCALYSDGGLLLAQGTIVRLAPKMGRRALPLESPTARSDVRIREVFVEVPASGRLVPGQRVWGRSSRVTGREP